MMTGKVALGETSAHRPWRTASLAALLLGAATIAGCSDNTAPGADPGTGTTDTQSSPTGMPSGTGSTDSDSNSDQPSGTGSSSGSGSSSTP